MLCERVPTHHSLAQVAQLVERSPEEGDVTSSNLVLSTTSPSLCSGYAVHALNKKRFSKMEKRFLLSKPPKVKPYNLTKL
jgi:hypothetical protein